MEKVDVKRERVWNEHLDSWFVLNGWRFGADAGACMVVFTLILGGQRLLANCTLTPTLRQGDV